MLKFFKVLIINILLIVLLIITADFIYSYNVYKNDVNNLINTGMDKGFDKKDIFQKIPHPPFVYSLKIRSFKSLYDEIDNFKNDIVDFTSMKRLTKSEGGGKSNKRPIIVFGDSFAECVFLKDNATFNYYLTKLTGRTVFNRGIAGTCEAHMLFMTKYYKFYDFINKESEGKSPEYAIYVFIPNHFCRIFLCKYGIVNKDKIFYINYKEKNGELVEDKNFLYRQLSRLTFARILIENNVNKQININPNLCFDLTKLYFIEARKELQKRYPDIKFIIIKHPQFNINMNIHSIDYKLYNSPGWKELEEKGFIIIDLNTYLGKNENVISKKYMLPDSHPNSYLWEVVSKKLVKDLNL